MNARLLSIGRTLFQSFRARGLLRFRRLSRGEMVICCPSFVPRNEFRKCYFADFCDYTVSKKPDGFTVAINGLAGYRNT